MDAATALGQLGGVATRRELGRWITPAEERAALESGVLVTLPRHRVALASLDEARLAAASVGGTVSHLSAALAHGWKVVAPPPSPTVTVPRNRRLPLLLPPLERHWADLAPERVCDGVTVPAQTVLDCSRAYARPAALAVADSALRVGAVTVDQLLSEAHASPRTGRSRAVWVAEHASGHAANPFESALRAAALEVPGLTVRPQGWVGSAGRADLVDERLLVAIEADSWQHHGHREAFRHDVRRYAEFARLGWVVVRFLWEDVMFQPARVRRHLAEVAAVRARQLGLDLLPANAGSSSRSLRH